ncbi:MAG: hypothetical protein PHU25_18510 [Deltaproteobacteria bacterium]|nr:hypothetical protein [Deltaproteobacteria bacterium]
MTKIPWPFLMLTLALFLGTCADDDTTDEPACEPATGPTATMSWVIADVCNDGQGPTFALYDATDNCTSWGDYWFEKFNQPYGLTISCVRGDKICMGAWLDDGYWGCGEGCKSGCEGCCYTCDDVDLPQVSLDCE